MDGKFHPDGADIHNGHQALRRINLLSVDEIDGNNRPGYWRADFCTPLLALLGNGGIVFRLRPLGAIQFYLCLFQVELRRLKLLLRNRATFVE